MPKSKEAMRLDGSWNGGYSTRQELAFLKYVGTGRWVRGLASRKDLLRRYRKVCEDRVNWEMIDKEAVLAYLDLELK